MKLKVTTSLLLTLGLAACGTFSDGYGYRNSKSAGMAGNDGTVAVCHKGKKTLYLPREAVKAHIDHGDRYGRC
ncbi:MAG: hypothetical protein K0M64_02550 [Rhizobium sp.]|nr:hypothetical protein [Rhizobium sp.]